MVRVVDEKSFSGVLIVTSSHVSFLVEEELKEPPLCKDEQKRKRRRPERHRGRENASIE